MSDETLQAQRLAALEKARQAPRGPRKPTATMKTEYLDDAQWVDLATARGLKLPNLATACTQAAVAPWLKRLGISRDEFTRWSGYQNPAAWSAANPTFSLRALVGLLLEDYPGPARG